RSTSTSLTCAVQRCKKLALLTNRLVAQSICPQLQMRRSSWNVPDTEGSPDESVGHRRRLQKIFDEEPPTGQHATHPKLFGICALAVGDVDGATQGGDPGAELVIGTLNND